MFAGTTGRMIGALVALAAMVVTTRADDLNDYPTSARSEYVFGCLKANGETRQAIEQCSCSIDVVASLVPYERYVTAETVLSMSSSVPPSRRPAHSMISGARRLKRKSGASDVGAASHQMPGASIFHSCWNRWPSVSLASARNCFAPLET